MSATVGSMAVHHLEYMMVRDLVALLHGRVPEIGVRVIFAHGDVGRLDKGRNRVVEHFLERDTEWLLWIDSDMTFNPSDFDALYRRAQAGNKIVSGLYYRDSDPPTPCMFRYQNAGDRKFLRVVKEFRKGPMNVDGVGLGFCLVHRSVYEKIPAPWHDNTLKGPGGDGLADDSSFCYQAQQAGFQIVVDTSVVLGHIKPTVLLG